MSTYFFVTLQIENDFYIKYPMGEKAKKLYAKLGKKYRFSIYNDTDYEQVWKARLSGWLVLSVVIPIIIGAFFLFFMIIAYTPIRNLIPGYPTNEIRHKIVSNIEKIDSLEKAVASWEGYFNSIQSFVSGTTDSIESSTVNVDSIENVLLAEYLITSEDSIFRAEIENEDKASLQVKNKNTIFENSYLYPPLKGDILSNFNPKTKHFGIDIKVSVSPIVTATLDGVVIFAGWTLNDNYVIQIQHRNSLVSIYKGNSTLFKSAGERVNAGEAIASVGNMHDGIKSNTLHIELWQNGIPVDPTLYIQF